MLDVLRACVGAARTYDKKPLDHLLRIYGTDFRGGTVQLQSLAYMVAATMIVLGELSSARSLLRSGNGNATGVLLPVDCEWKYLNTILFESDEEFRGALKSSREYSKLAMLMYDRVNPFAKALISHISVELRECPPACHLEAHSSISQFKSDGGAATQVERANGSDNMVLPNYLSEAVAIINKHDSTDLSVSHIAELVGVSERTLREAFQRNFGVSPKSFILRARLEHAQSLLSLQKGSSWTITELANICGFNHVGRFSKAYSRLFGVSPAKATQSRVNIHDSRLEKSELGDEVGL
jgi:AraC-like DNA-binding protein